MVDVYVGVGSNIEPEYHVKLAVAQLQEHFEGLRCSDVFRSPAFGFEGDDFLNMVVAFPSAAGADAVEQVLSGIEYAGGRTRRRARFSPRTLDLDLLLYGAMVDARRRLPRDDVCRYPFVLAPLADLAPDLPHPLTGRPIGEAWRAMAGRSQPPARIGPVTTLP